MVTIRCISICHYQRPVSSLCFCAISHIRISTKLFSNSLNSSIIQTMATKMRVVVLGKVEIKDGVMRYQQFGAQVSKSDTGNKPQSASAGRDVIQINYYGTDYSAAKTDGQLSMDPSKFTKPVADILAGPALKSPTVEECGYSDRIQQLTIGNSTITTQEAANAVVAYGVWPSYDSGAGEAIDKMSTPGPEVDRFYTLDSIEWNANIDRGYYWKLPAVLTDLGMFGQNCQYHYMQRSGFLVHFQLNATKFHQGMMLIAAIPECQIPTQSAMVADEGEISVEFEQWYPRAQLTLFPHQIVNLRTNNAATLILPYTCNFPAECHLIHNTWTVVAMPIVALAYQQGASPIVPITMSIAPMFASFSGLRNMVAQTQGGVPVHTVPGSGQFLTTLRQAGYPIYPDFESTHGWPIPGEVSNLMEVAQVDTFVAMDPTKTTELGRISLQVQQGKHDTPIFTWDMDLNATWAADSYLARLAKWFVNWRGSVTLTFTFAGSAMATGKFLIAYTPPGGAAPSTRTDAMLGTHAIWDVGLQSSFSFVVPWIATTQYRYTAKNASAMSLLGYLTMWYQTAVVVPPGAPPACNITCMMSAAKDFVFRMPTDDAYYQGPTDTIPKVINTAIEHAIQRVDVAANIGNALPAGGALTTGDAPALTAAETGVSADTTAGTLMETRDVRITFSARETSVENFFTKYAPFYYKELSRPFFDTIPMYFAQASTTQRAIRAKYRMFTFFRCDWDIVAIVSRYTHGTGQSTSPSPLKFQIMYSPPGTAQPAAYNSALWDCPTTPSIYGCELDPPVSMRIPFTSPANAYNVFYDGYATFSATRYGEPPANDMGNLSFRLLDVSPDTNVGMKVFLRLFARPVNIHAWCPRPLVTLKTATTRSAASRNRLYYVDDAETQNVVYEQLGSDVEMEEQDIPFPMQQVPSYALDVAQQCVILYHKDTGYFHGIPFSNDKVAAPLHLVNWAGSYLETRNGPDHISVEYCWDYDLAILTYPKRSWRPIPLADETTPTEAWIVNTCKFRAGVYVPGTYAMQEIEVGASNWCDEHKQRGIIRCDVTTGPGWCGSPLITRQGVCGFVTAGLPGITCVTGFHYVNQCWPMEVEERKENFKIAYQLKQRKHNRRHRKGRKFSPYGPCDRVVGYIQNVCRDLGRSFGESAMEGVQEQALSLIPEDIDVSSGIVRKVLSWLVKVVCGMVLIAKSEDKAGTAAAVGVMLGVDILTSSPFEWLKGKVIDACRVAKYQLQHARHQGPIEWVKDFNAFCTAFRGLDWIGEKVKAFVDWIKELFKQENPARKRFMKQLEQLPQLMESIDKATQERGKYQDSDVIKLCENMRTLKLGADIFGVERNFCTQQIVRYYQKAEYLMRTCNKTRVEPVAICIHGGPGSGKSLATTIIAQALCNRAGKGLPYSLPPDPKYFDGYCQQHAVIMDDICQNPDGEDMKLFCQMVSSAPFQVPMASLEEKGTAFTSPFVLCSTNANYLTPPTIATPKALERRFYLDLDIKIMDGYCDRGRLKPAAALARCYGESECCCFKNCTPFCCGRAVRFCDRNNRGKEYSLDQIVLLMEEEWKQREQCGGLLDAIFQGPVPQPRMPRGVQQKLTHMALCKRDLGLTDAEEWLSSEFDDKASVLKTIDECKASGVQALPCPREIEDLLQACKSPEVISYCEAKGWIVPQKCVYQRTRVEVGKWVTYLAEGLAILASMASIAGTIYMIYSLVARMQGAYSGQPQKQVKPPVVRRVLKQGPQQDFGTRLFNTSLFNVHTSKGSFSGLGLYGKWLLLPKHSQPEDEIQIEDQKFQILDQVEFTKKNGYSLELVAVKIDRPVCFRDIRRYLKTSHHTEKGCWLLVNTDNFPRTFCPVNQVTPNGLMRLEDEMVDNTCRYPYPTKSGQCGGVVIDGDNKIIAMHVGGDGWNGYGSLLYQKYFERLDEAELQGEKSAPRPAPRSVNVNRRTVLRPSVFFDVFEGTKEPAALSSRDKRLEVDLDSAMFGKYKGNCQVEEPTENMLLAVEHYVSQLRPILPENLTEPLELEEVVYGTEGLDGLDLNTSAGYPYNTMGISKKKLIPQRGQPLTELQNALDLHGYNLPFTTYLKDELRPIEKVRAGKTRLIECSSVNDTIRMKMTLGRLFATFHQNPGIVTGCAVGCDPDTDWSKFYAEIGDRPLLAFDYSNYDASLSPVWFTCLKLVLQKLGYCADELISHICNSTHIYADQEYDVEGGMPSGCSGTSVFNSIINNLIIKTCVLDVYKGIDLDELRIIAYGDDVIASYPFPLDAALLAEAGSRYGLTMTPADKSSCFNEVTWETVTFLKRRFVPDEQFPFLIHPVFPLSEASESIRWCRSAATTQEHVVSLCYLVWHNGEQAYEEFLRKIRTVPVGRVLFLPAYRVLRAEWLDKF